MWVEKSGWCCLQPAAYNLVRFPVYTMTSLPAWIHSLKSICSVYCHTAIQHHSITYRMINLSLEAEYMATVPTYGLSLHSSHGIVWVACLWREIIWFDTSFKICFYTTSSVILKTTVEVYVCIHLPNQLYHSDNSLLSNTIYTPTGLVTYNCHIMWWDDRTAMIQKVRIMTQEYLLIIHVVAHTCTRTHMTHSNDI